MAKYLVSTTEVYRVDTEDEATRAIEEAKNEVSYTLGKYTSERKEVKSKGEVIDEYWKLSLTKLFNDIKEADTPVTVSYEIG
jgi:hypothetical protein